MQRIVLVTLILIISSIASALTSSEPALDEYFSSVVFIRAEDADENNESVPAFCNATLLSERLLITAAHCVLGNRVLGHNSLEIQVGKYIYKTNPKGEVRRIGYGPFLTQTVKVKYHFSPSLTAQMGRSGLRTKIGPSDDIALVELQSELTLPKPHPFAKIIPKSQLRGVTGRWVNYWPTIVTINPFTEMSLDTRRWARLNDLKNGSYLESKSQARVEEGDSGSPLFLRIGTDWYLTGITKGKAETFFSNWDVFGLLDDKLCSFTSTALQSTKDLVCFP